MLSRALLQARLAPRTTRTLGQQKGTPSLFSIAKKHGRRQSQRRVRHTLTTLNPAHSKQQVIREKAKERRRTLTFAYEPFDSSRFVIFFSLGGDRG